MLKIPLSENPFLVTVPDTVVITFINVLPPFLCWGVLSKGLLGVTKSHKIL